MEFLTTHVNVNASVCFPEGSLSRSVESDVILESIGRYGTLICRFDINKENGDCPKHNGVGQKRIRKIKGKKKN